MSKGKQNKKTSQNLSKKVFDETLTEKEHKLFLEECKNQELLNAYNDLKDLELADLSDFFGLEDRSGGI